MKLKIEDSHVQNNTASVCQNWFNYFMQYRSISKAKNRLVGLLILSLGSATLCYKHDQ